MKSTSKAPLTKSISTKTLVRGNTEYDHLLTPDDRSRLITGTSTINPIGDLTVEANPVAVYQSNGTDVDLESNQLGETNIAEIPSKYPNIPWLNNLSTWQIWLILLVLFVLFVVTLILYFTGNTELMISLWRKILCWLGLMDCSK